jgi:hypothetical protein
MTDAIAKTLLKPRRLRPMAERWGEGFRNPHGQPSEPSWVSDRAHAPVLPPKAKRVSLLPPKAKPDAVVLRAGLPAQRPRTARANGRGKDSPDRVNK